MNQRNKPFKVGDKVYYPNFSNNIYELKANSQKDYPVKIVGVFDRTFTKDGKESRQDNVPAIFHATKENCNKLSELYGIQFEEPKSFLDIHLEKGSKVLCLIVTKDINYLPKYVWELDYDKYDIEVIKKKVNDTYLSGYSAYSNIKDIYPIAIDGKGRITYLD